VETFSVIKTSFAWWFGLALWLIALGLACVLVQESVGSALGWTGRAAQYMGCVYFIIAFFVAQREQTSLDGTGSQNPAWSLWPYLEQRVAERTTELAQFNSALQTEIHERNKLETSLRESELKHRRMTANISDVIAIMSSAGTLSYKSPNIETNFGWLPEDLVGTNGWATVHPDDLQRIQKEFVALLGKDNTKKSVEYRYLCKDGSYKMIALTAINLSIDPTINGVLMNYRDITEQKKAEEALKMSEEQYRNLVDFLPSGVMVYRAGKIILANQTIARVFGANDPSELIGTALVERVHPDYVDSMTNLVRKLIQESGETPWGEVKLLRMDGSSFDAEVSVMTSIYHYSPVLISVINDITERKQAEEQIRLMNAELQSLAVTDFLTKLPNRRYLIERGDEEFKRSRRYHQALTFFMIDIDHFKDINDRFGHEAGDQVLQQIAAILKSNLREIDIPARVGGEEFVVMLVNTTLKDATCLAERIRVAIAETVYHAQSQEIRCTASLGVALLSDDMVDLDKLMRTADDAMYRAKQAGRNRVMY
jgi:diguanylate cyclase (GGDEF)-like protein/PAS domain S-box-containing protein